MHAELQTHIAFHLTGKRQGEELDAVDELALRPALLAGYRDLTKLRYDFPVVLARIGSDAPPVQSLSGLLDSVLREIAPPGSEGERLRKHVLRLEQEIRTLAATGTRGSLSALWDTAAKRLASPENALFAESLSRARAALKIDGEVIDCNEETAERLATHAWKTVQAQKARTFNENTSRLILKLSDILRADFVRSEAGRSAKSLQAAVGATHDKLIDFEMMSRLLTKASPRDTLPESRRRRIEWALSALRAQQFFPLRNGHGEASDAATPHAFLFESCTKAFVAFRERLPEMVEVAKAIAVAELEIEGQYVESKHDAFFADFGEHMLSPQDRAAFPDYLVCVRAASMHAVENARLMEILAAGLPIKVLVQTDDLLEASPISGGHLSFGTRSVQLARMAIGLNQAYVLQSSASNLLQYSERILKGMVYPGPALFSVFSGAAGKKTDDLPPYLTAAAAMESRAFPAYAYDPSAGPDWASRFSLADNPQVDCDWPVQSFDYEDGDHQRISEDLAFTFVDFVACDRRYAAHFARVPRAQWNGSMITVGEVLGRDAGSASEKVPCLLMVDSNDVLQKVLVDDTLISEARRCAEMWHNLQELGGIHNSHAERLLAREKKIWEAQQQPAPVAQVGEPKPAAEAPTPAAPAAQPAQPGPVEEKPSDDPYIETPRCTSCDECTQINNRMFAYDANKQAYVANVEAGTYRQLVEAAESCQVSIIHPGKPRNPSEPGLEELVKRAEAFM
jgi:hypothetical protein